MKRLITLLFAFFLAGYSQEIDKSFDAKDNIIPIFMAFDGIAIATLWTIDIHKNNLLKDGFFKSEEEGKLFWPHLIAEYGTALGLVVSAYGLYNNKEWAKSSSLISLGALTYTSLSSMGWSLAKKERMIYVTPMLISLAGAGLSITVII